MSSAAADDPVFKALADWRRRSILDLLKAGPRTTGELCDQFRGLDRCTVMQHLRVLEAAELIIIQRKGRQRWNYLNPLPIKKIHDRWIGRYASGAVGLLARLKYDLERSGAADRAEAPEARVRTRGGNRR
jgi:DNA-binding transcriptional ArsR family regulator